ncbi:phospholipase A1 [Amyelois transitella]|uniref:phospholipase A1 n=1 Tax=Amyelois transitella TaxID=680683 RepID=UPI00067C5775|nr:phospholipase A1 [Amyelois transitella]
MSVSRKMLRSQVSPTLITFILVLGSPALVGTFAPPPDIGYPAGLIPECPGVLKNATISPKMAQLLQVIVHQSSIFGATRRSLPIPVAAKMVAADKSIDLKNKKTVLYAVGYLDSSMLPHSQALANTYLRRGYNVFVTETFSFLTYIYPKSVRLTRAIGKKLGEFLVKLSEQGMEAENLELVGLSLGAHIVGYAAKHFYAATGKKPSRITGLDPAGPCFRSLPSEYRLDSSDADKVDVVHTNIDGFGIAERLGHVDFYVNGGEFQPGDLSYVPCLVICSHVKSLLYWWQALEHPKMFIGVKCDSVQDARLANCYNNSEVNYLGAETRFSRPGIFYLGTNNGFPYYRGKDGLKPENEIYTSVIRSINSDDLFEVK